MPNRLILELGTGQLEKPIKGTVTQIRAAVRRYAKTVGIPTEGVTDKLVGEAVLDHLLLQIKEVSKSSQRTDKFAELTASIEAQLELDNDIY